MVFVRLLLSPKLATTEIEQGPVGSYGNTIHLNDNTTLLNPIQHVATNQKKKVQNNSEDGEKEEVASIS
jgi:hypothetical protein